MVMADSPLAYIRCAKAACARLRMVGIGGNCRPSKARHSACPRGRTVAGLADEASDPARGSYRQIVVFDWAVFVVQSVQS